MDVTLNLIYIIGLLGFSLLMAGLYLSALAANQRQAQDHGVNARHLHTEVAYFADRFATQRRESHRLKDALARAEGDLSTSHAHASAYLEELDRLKAANLATVRAYNDMANEYAWFRSLVAAENRLLYQSALIQSKAAGAEGPGRGFRARKLDTALRKVDVPVDQSPDPTSTRKVDVPVDQSTNLALDHLDKACAAVTRSKTHA